LVAGSVWVVDNEEGDAFDLGRDGESDDGFAVAVGAETEGLPGFGGGLAVGWRDFEHAFVSLGVSAATALGFLDDLAGVLGVKGAEKSEAED
jgi:hypothetical protein